MSRSAESASTTIAKLAELFAHDLEGVSFPDVDHQRLDLALRNHAEARAKVEEAEAACAQAREGLRAQHLSMSALAERTVAYLRVYAAEDAELSKKLDELAPKRRSPKRRGSKRGRDPKVAPTKSSAQETTESSVARAS